MIYTGGAWMNKVQNMLLKSFLNVYGASLRFYTVVYALVFHGTADGPATFICSENFFLIGVENDSFWRFQFAFCATCATIVGRVIICVTVLLLLLVPGACHDSSTGFVLH